MQVATQRTHGKRGYVFPNQHVLEGCACMCSRGMSCLETIVIGPLVIA